MHTPSTFMGKPMAKIVCVGLACLDYLFRVPELPRKGGKYFADNYAAAPGGPAAAAAIAVAALGHESIFIGRLGNDQVGDDVIRQLEHRKVDTAHIRRIDNHPSQVSSVAVDSGGERQIINYSSSGLDPDPAWIPAALIEGADFLLADVRWPEGAERALSIARTHGVPSLLDADVAPVDIGRLVDRATYAIFSQRGLETLSREPDVEKALVKVLETSGAWPAVTLGENGSYWLEGNEMHHCPAEKIEPVDTCGAGDVFHGAFAVAMAEKMGIGQAMRFAGAAAALKCLRFGGSLGVADRASVDRYLSD